jgi:hypothetical protein
MKYARPTYRALNVVDPELAKKTFLEYGVKFLHPIARGLVAKVRLLFILFFRSCETDCLPPFFFSVSSSNKQDLGLDGK